MARPPFTPTIESLPHLVPFVGPEAMERARGRPFRARLGANESIFGPSPMAVAAMRDAAAENWKYADPENFELRAAIATHHAIPARSVVVGEGIDGGLTCMLFLQPGDRVLTTDGAYPTFNFHVRAHGGLIEALPVREFREDVPRLIERAAVTNAKFVYVSNPNSPLGSWWDGENIKAFVDALPNGTMLILDEAYCDSAPEGTAPPVDTANDAVLRYRTFSKAYGLAGARIGYCAGHPDVIQAFEKVRNHYGVNRVGQIGALAALRDQNYLADAVARIASARDAISAIATANRLKPLPSAASFVAIDCGRDGAYARAILDGLLKRDVFVRKPTAANIDHLIRVSCGPGEDLAVFADALAATCASIG